MDSLEVINLSQDAKFAWISKLQSNLLDVSGSGNSWDANVIKFILHYDVIYVIYVGLLKDGLPLEPPSLDPHLWMLFDISSFFKLDFDEIICNFKNHCEDYLIEDDQIATSDNFVPLWAINLDFVFSATLFVKINVRDSRDVTNFEKNSFCTWHFSNSDLTTS